MSRKLGIRPKVGCPRFGFEVDVHYCRHSCDHDAEITDAYVICNYHGSGETTNEN